MSALPRGTCSACGGDVALRRGGLVREHHVYLPQAQQDPSTPLGRMRVCEGSGLVPQATNAIAGESGPYRKDLPGPKRGLAA